MARFSCPRVVQANHNLFPANDLQHAERITHAVDGSGKAAILIRQ